MNFIGFNLEEKIDRVCVEYANFLELLSNMELSEEDIDFFNYDFPETFSQVLMQNSQYHFYVPDTHVVTSLNNDFYYSVFRKLHDLFAALLEFSYTPEEETKILRTLYKARLIILVYVPESYFTLENIAKRKVTASDIKVYEFEEEHKFDLLEVN